MRATVCVAALGLVLLLVPASLADTPTPTPTPPPAVFTRFKPDDLAAILRGAGYRAEVVHVTEGYRIRTGMSGRKVTVYLFCSADGDCGSIDYDLNYTADPDFTLTLANKWNREKRYAKAYIGTDGSIFLEYSVAFNGGVTNETVAESARLFERLIGEFDNATNNK
jgi:hypothetical protein